MALNWVLMMVDEMVQLMVVVLGMKRVMMLALLLAVMSGGMMEMM